MLTRYSKSQKDLKSVLLGLALVALILAACTAPVEPEPPTEEPKSEPVEELPDEPDAPPTASPTASPTTTPSPEPSPEEGAVPPSGTVDIQQLTPVVTPFSGNIVQPPPGVPDPAARAAQLAKSDLAELTGKDVSEIVVVSVEATNWPDTSLGCPQKGSMYLQVITPGFKIVLELNGVHYTYHTDMGSHIVRCN